MQLKLLISQEYSTLLVPVPPTKQLRTLRPLAIPWNYESALWDAERAETIRQGAVREMTYSLASAGLMLPCGATPEQLRAYAERVVTTTSP